MAAMLNRLATSCLRTLNNFCPRYLQRNQQILHDRLNFCVNSHLQLHTPVSKSIASTGNTSIVYTIRQGRREDIPGMFQLVSEAGWNHTIDYLHIPFDCFPEGVFVAESADGEIISQCAALPLDDQTGFMSYYITKDSFRGQGIGYQVSELSRETLGNRNIGFDAIWDYVDMYTARGIKVKSFTLQVYEFPAKNIIQTLGEKSPCTIVGINEVDPQMIVEYDKKIHPMPREKVLKWTLGYCTVGRVAVAGDEIKGWGALCKGRRGYRLMPLYSDTPDVAHDLTQDLLMQVVGNKGAEIEICLPEDNVAVNELLHDLGVFNGEYRNRKMKRMYNKHDVPVSTHLVYSVMNNEQVLT